MPRVNSANKAQAPNFIRRFSDPKRDQISVRIASTVKDDFDKAKRILEASGMTMELTEVIEDALRSAAKFVFLEYGSDEPKKSERPAPLASSQGTEVMPLLPQESEQLPQP